MTVNRIECSGHHSVNSQSADGERPFSLGCPYYFLRRGVVVYRVDADPDHVLFPQIEHYFITDR